MKLRSLHKTLCEDISRTDLYDFYALLHAYHEPNFIVQDQEYKTEVKDHLENVVDLIYTDHMGQIGKLIIERLIPSDGNPHYDEIMDIFHKHNIKFISREWGHEITNLTDLTINDLANLFSDLVTWGKASNDRSFQYFTSGSGSWAALASKYIDLTTARSLSDKILAIERIYKLMHHGGPLVEYFDEKKWIEDALHTRADASMSEILSKASANIRELLGSAQHGIIGKSRVSNLEKLRTALDRATTKVVSNHKISGDKIIGYAELLYMDNLTNSHDIGFTEYAFTKKVLGTIPVHYSIEIIGDECHLLIKDKIIDISYTTPHATAERITQEIASTLTKEYHNQNPN